MKFLKKYGYLFLLLFAVGDFSIPYILGPKIANYSQLHQVISALGSVTSPIKNEFRGFSIFTGSMLLLALPKIYQRFKATSVKDARLLVLSLALFGIGDCIFTGLFSISRISEGLTLATAIHGAGSGIGIVGMLLVPLILARLFEKEQQAFWSKLLLIIFAVSLVVSVWNGLGQLINFSYKGLWQRVSLALMYCPVILLVVHDGVGTKVFSSEK